MGGACSTYEGEEKSMLGFGDKRSLWSPRRGWEGNITTYRKDIRREYVEWLLGTDGWLL